MYAGRGAVIITGTLAATLTLTAATTLASCSTETGSTTPTSQPAASVVTIPTGDTTGPAATTTIPAPTSSVAPSNPIAGGFDVLANMPTAAKQHTNAGAQAFARYYIEAYGRLLMDPAKGQLAKLYLPQCRHCEMEEKNIADSLDTSVRWKDVYFRTVNVTEPDVNGDIVNAADRTEVHVAALLTTVAVAVQHGSAPATTRAKGQDVFAHFQLNWHDGQWYVADLKSQLFTPAAQ